MRTGIAVKLDKKVEILWNQQQFGVEACAKNNCNNALNILGTDKVFSNRGSLLLSYDKLNDLLFPNARTHALTAAKAYTELFSSEISEFMPEDADNTLSSFSLTFRAVESGKIILDISCTNNANVKIGITINQQIL